MLICIKRNLIYIINKNFNWPIVSKRKIFLN